MRIDILKKGPLQFSEVNQQIKFLFKRSKGFGVDLVPVKEWQARETQVNMMVIRNLELSLDVPSEIPDSGYNKNKWQLITNCDLPWAEDHFQERFSGEPLNPAPSYQWWPYYKQPEKWETSEKHQFSHTYPERYWTPPIQGIRYPYGNLKDVINLIKSNPQTRQAYLPMWFPEDTGAVHGERVPCSIGYLFTCKHSQNNWVVDIHYQLRSCDYIRHFKNDIYLTGRLLQAVVEELNKDTPQNFVIGQLHVSIANLHIFEGEEEFWD